MSDPENGSVRVVRRRRRTRRHRRNRLIRRGLVTVVLAVFVGGVSTLALHVFSPSIFSGRQSGIRIAPADPGRNASKILDQVLAQRQPQRPVYPYSVVPGGVENAKELKWVAEHDPIVAAHYAGFDYARAQVVRLVLARTVYVSYRIGNHIYWSRRRLILHKGEKLITDGRITARVRCANRVEETPQQQAAAPAEPPVARFDEPVKAGSGTAMQSPPFPFESTLLNRPVTPGLEPAGPLSLYDPFVGGNFIALAPPPLPEGLCSPIKKKGNGIEITSTGGKKKKLGPCGGGGVEIVPEPGTWLLFASGLVLICWQARHKFARP